MEPNSSPNAASRPTLNRNMKDWFEVDRDGLARILERKGKEFTLFELIQNAWDEPGVSKVTVSLEYRGRNKALLVVEDDAPEGFLDLRHAFTLFADSAKKANPDQRGRFNLGEKLVLAISEEVNIHTTRGGLRFDSKGRHNVRSAQAAGSRIECLIRMTADECEGMESHMRKLISPAGIVTTFNGEQLQPRPVVKEFKAVFRTEIADQEGYLRKADRETTVRLYDLLPGEKASIYEMGIPVVETGDKWHYDIGQKVPLTIDRENVHPRFLCQVRVAVFNRVHQSLGQEDVNSEWVEMAIASPDCAPGATESYLGKRFGEKRVSFDPSDNEANRLAASKGFTVVHGSMMSSGAWKNAKMANAILPAGQVTPGAKVWTGEENPDADTFKDWIPEARWTQGMRQVADFARLLGEKVLHRVITVKFCATPHHVAAASYRSTGELVFNKLRLGGDWFEQGITEDVVRLIIHEFGHEYSPDHLSADYHEALCRIGARMFALARNGDLR